MKNDLNKKIERYLSRVAVSNKLDKFNMCAAVYEMLAGSPDAVTGFAYFMENADSIESNRTQEVVLKYSKSDVDRLEKQLGDMVDAVFGKILKSNLQETAFYTELWKALTQSYVFDSEESIVFAIYFIVIDTRIPYFYIPAEKQMSDATFKDITKRNRRDVDKVRYIITSNQFDQWTTQAAALLRVLDTKHNDDRTVLMAHILKVMDAAKRVPQLSANELPDELIQLIRQKLPAGRD